MQDKKRGADMVEYQDFNIGKHNAKWTVAQERTDLGLPLVQVVRKSSEQVLQDILAVFDYKYYSNGYTGERNFNNEKDIYQLSLAVKVAGTSLMQEGITFYQKQVRWGSKHHKNFAPMLATVIGETTYLLQSTEPEKRYFTIRQGVLMAQGNVPQQITIEALKNYI